MLKSDFLEISKVHVRSQHHFKKYFPTLKIVDSGENAGEPDETLVVFGECYKIGSFGNFYFRIVVREGLRAQFQIATMDKGREGVLENAGIKKIKKMMEYVLHTMRFIFGVDEIDI
jgi:hypothetical protein